MWGTFQGTVLCNLGASPHFENSRFGDDFPPSLAISADLLQSRVSFPGSVASTRRRPQTLFVCDGRRFDHPSLGPQIRPEIRKRAYDAHRSWRGLQWYVDETGTVALTEPFGDLHTFGLDHVASVTL